MTEAEWLACEDPERLLGVVDGKPSGRKRRLVAAGCCRLVAPLLPEGPARAAPELAEAVEPLLRRLQRGAMNRRIPMIDLAQSVLSGQEVEL